MHKTAARRKATRSEYDLYDDLEKIKSALSDAAVDVKGRAGEILSQSIEDVKDRTHSLQSNAVEYITEKPFKTISLSVLAGMAIGYLLHHK
jgi:ElaB/YqjD/DUF883 family membrane-anchored ribosome-binding protein